MKWLDNRVFKVLSIIIIVCMIPWALGVADAGVPESDPTPQIESAAAGILVEEAPEEPIPVQDLQPVPESGPVPQVEPPVAGILVEEAPEEPIPVQDPQPVPESGPTPQVEPPAAEILVEEAVEEPIPVQDPQPAPESDPTPQIEPAAAAVPEEITAMAPQAQIMGAFRGTVNDGNGAALPGVPVELYLGAALVASNTTDHTGSYDIPVSESGMYTLQVAKGKYGTPPVAYSAYTSPEIDAIDGSNFWNISLPLLPPPPRAHRPCRRAGQRLRPP